MKARFESGLIAFLSLIIAATSVAAADDIDASNVYQRINDADTNGLSVGRFKEGVTPPTTDIVLDEQNESTGGRGNDPSPRPLFRTVNETKFTTGTYPELILLLDNYVPTYNATETYPAAEEAEIDQFVDKVILTEPMRVARAYINDELSQGLTEAEFKQQVKRMWFELYTNHFGSPVKFCSGFEHVFVGEGEFSLSGSAPPRGEVKGYHGWVQFLRQEKAGEVNYLGHKYGLPPARLPANPGVITLRMIWNHDPDDAGPKPKVELFKPTGGFFVGASPECEMAMGTVAFFERAEGLLNNDMRRTVINGATYDLVLHPETQANGQAGNRIRTFFPILIGMSQPIDDDTPPMTPGDGRIVIVRALPNPDGDDETGEWVEIKNTTGTAIDLTGWEIRDRQAGTRKLDGTLDANATKRFDVTRAAHTLRMGNSGGQLRLFQSDELVDEVTYGQAAKDRTFDFHQ